MTERGDPPALHRRWSVSRRSQFADAMSDPMFLSLCVFIVSTLAAISRGQFDQPASP